jgi:hypothetical protein
MPWGSGIPRGWRKRKGDMRKNIPRLLDKLIKIVHIYGESIGT